MPSLTRLSTALSDGLPAFLSGAGRRFVRGAKPKLLGLGFLAVVGGLIALSIAFYAKTFTPTTDVTLEADRVGNQLGQQADVKLRGLIVGDVRSVRSTGTGALLKLALKPEMTKLIPNDVQARILPKTLFGEKFVDLVVPAGQPTGVPAIKAGDVIPQDRSSTAIEIGKVFDDLVPVLQTVQPAKLNSTLSSIATALQGRGDALGDNLVRAQKYFKGFNPALDDLNTDISELADLADNLNGAAPDFFRLLANSSAESDNVVKFQPDLIGFLKGTNGFATTATRVLANNEQGLVTLGKVSKPILTTVRDNGTFIPYIFQGLTQLTPRINDALGGQGPYLHIRAQVVKDRGPYVLPEDCPTYVDGEALGPNCPGYKKGATNGAVTPTADMADPSGTRAEQDQIAGIVGAATHQPTGQVSGLADLLYGPALRGTEVSYS